MSSSQRRRRSTIVNINNVIIKSSTTTTNRLLQQVQSDEDDSRLFDVESPADFVRSSTTLTTTQLMIMAATNQRRKSTKKPSKTEVPLIAFNFQKTPEKIDTSVHIYISYASANRPLVKQIVNVLKQQRNFDVWVDYERTPSGWVFDNCMKAITKADFVMLFMSEPYKASDSCHSEATHAFLRKKELLIVKLQHPCEPDGWIEPIFANRLHVNFDLRYRAFVHVMDDLLKQCHVLAEKVKPSSITDPLKRSKSLERIQELKEKSFDALLVETAVDRMRLRRFDAMKLVMSLRTFNSIVFDIDFIEAIHRAESQHTNGGIFELCKRLHRTEAKAFVLVARAARQAGGMISLAEAVEDTVIEMCSSAKVDDIELAATLLTQLFEGFDVLHLGKRKAHVVDQIKRLNMDLYLALVEIVESKRKDTIQRLQNTGKRLKRFGKFPMPERDDGICIKPKNEQAVRNAIRTLCEESEGILAIIGEKGLGKSPLVSKLLLDDEFLLRDCRVDIVAWMNVFEFAASGCFIDERRFYLALADAIGLLVNFTIDVSIERQLERYLSQREHGTLVVLENVYSSHVISLTANFEQYIRVIAISPNIECVSAACSRYRSQVIIFEKVPQTKIETYLGDKLPPSLDRLKITSLAMLCDGLPLVAKMLASQFAFCKEEAEAESKYRLLVENNPEKLQQFALVSPRPATQQNGSSGDDAKIVATISNIFHLNFERESRELFRRYSAVLWFGQDEIVEIGDLALLWGCPQNEVAPFCEEHFVSKSLLQSIDVYDATPNNTTGGADSVKRQCFKMHSLLHEIVLDFARKKSKARKRYSLSTLTLQAGRTYPERRPGENILHLAARLHKRVIFSAVVNFVAGDAEDLLALCQEKEDNNGQTPLDYLANEDWKDEKEAHLYKDTALGLMFLVYERIATSKIKPGIGVETMAKRVQLVMVDLLEKILAKLDGDKDEPLLWAARENFGAIALALLERGAFPNTRDRVDGNTALTLFSRHGNELLVRILLHGQQQQNVSWIGLSLVRAVAAGRESLVRFLLDKGALPDSCDDDGESAVIKAVKTQNYRILSLLLENGADPNVIERNIHTERFNPSKNVSALMLATELGSEDMVTLLLHHFADPAAKNSFGETPLMIATKRGLKNIVDILKFRTKLIKI